MKILQKQLVNGRFYLHFCSFVLLEDDILISFNFSSNQDCFLTMCTFYNCSKIVADVQ